MDKEITGHIVVVNKNENTTTTPIDWIQIINDNDNKILFNIPYTNMINVTTFENAVYKKPILYGQREDLMKCIEFIYDFPSIVCPNQQELLNTNFKLNLKTEQNYTRLFFICNMLRHIGGLVTHIDKTDLVFDILTV